VARAGFAVTGQPTSYERAADSGNVVSQTFCGRCGAALYSTNSASPDVVFLRASSLDDPDQFVPGMIVYASRAPSWARLDPTLATFSEMPPVEQRP
jgi:hypothetical protein